MRLILKIRFDRYFVQSLIVVCWMICNIPNVLAQEPSFRAYVNKNTVRLNQTFQITFELEGADGKNFQPPDFSNFRVLSGPNRTTSFQWINGVTRNSISFTYYLQAIKEGEFEIGPATITANGKTLQSNPVKVTVSASPVAGSGKKQGGQPASGNQPDDIYDQIAENVFLRVVVDKTEVYQGEQVTAEFRLYTRADIYNTSITEAPAFNGFWVQDLENPQQLQFTKERYNGVWYNVAPIRKVALFPQRSGTLEIDPMTLETTVRVRVRQRGYDPWGMFGDFFGSYRDIPYKFSSNPVKIYVKPLPVTNKPASFSGAVGIFSMTMTVDKTEMNTDEPLTFKITISGRGNIKMLQEIKPALPQDFEVYDPKVKENITIQGNYIKGSKTFEYLVIPRRPGEYKINPVEFSYFDLEKSTYITLRSPEYVIKVTGEPGTSSTVISNLNKEDVELIGQDIRYIKTNTKFNTPGRKYFGSLAFTLATVSPFLLFAGLLFVRRKQRQLAADIAGMKSRKARREAKKRLATARSHWKSGKTRQFYDELSRAIWAYLSDKLNIPQSELNREIVRQKLTERELDEETISRLFEILDTCEMSVYAPVSSGQNGDSLLKEAEQLISTIEKELK